MFRYLVTLIIFTLVLAGVLLLVESSHPEWVGNSSWAMLAYFFVLTAAFHWGLLGSSKGNPLAFIRYYMGATSFKLLIHLGILVLYAFFFGQHVVRFIVTFLFGYVLYTGLEVFLSWKRFRRP
jgi:hypothetical protein